MKKQLLLAMFIAMNINIHAMNEKMNETSNATLVLYNPHIMPIMTHHLLTFPSPNSPKKFYDKVQDAKKNFAVLAEVNKPLSNYYADESTKFTAVRILSDRLSESDDYVTVNYLPLKTICTKIKYLCDIACDPNKSFISEELANPLYRDCTVSTFPASWLTCAIRNEDLQKIIALINAGIDINGKKAHDNHLRFFAWLRYSWTATNRWLDGIALLLKNDANPNYRYSDRYPTPLMQTTSYGDALYTQLLLQHNANPYLMDHSTNRNAFDVEPEKGWLKRIIDEVAQKKKTTAITAKDEFS
jgi:hypothetical protein